MHSHNGQPCYTPSDLVEFCDSVFAAWMSRLHLEDPNRVQPDPDPPEFAILAKQGLQHEQAICAQLCAAGRYLYTVPGEGDRAALTLAAMRAGYPLIYQGELSVGEWTGRPDFLARVEGPSVLGPYHYEVWDAKCARVAQPGFLVQLCCYADLLAALQDQRPERVWLVLGDRRPVAFRTDDYYYYYRILKQAFCAWMTHFDPQVPPEPDLGGSYGRWTSHAYARLEAADHLSRVATITLAQIAKLQAAGIHTLTALATTTRARIPKLDDRVFARLREQAQLQRTSAMTERPAYRILSPMPEEPRRGLALLPPASPLDVYFDLEGYPLVDGGLEYLFGATAIENETPHYYDWWAHDAAEERRAFEHCVDWLFARWRADPTMHIYHYAAYEVTALRKLMGRYGTREAEVDTLLRHEVFVDLYTIVRQGLRVGASDCSLKSLERLYRAPRTGDVLTADQSLVFYDRWLTSGEPRHWDASPCLQAIRAYNREDCESTWQCTVWLRTRQQEAGIAWAPKPNSGRDDAQQEDEAERISPQHALAESLLTPIPPETAWSPADAERWRLQKLLAHTVEFHWREAKPLWWTFFERQAMTEEELCEDLNCLGGLRRLPDPPEPLKQSRGFWYAFDPDQDTKLEAGARCYTVPHVGFQPAIDQLDRERGRLCLKVGPRILKQLPGGAPPERLSLIPNDNVQADVIATSITGTATQWRDDGQISSALEDFLRRRPPRIIGYTGGPLIPADADLLTTTVRVIAALEQSTLCIQGPPGAGKTTVAAHAIVALLQQGKRIGVTANSHAAILNVLRKAQEVATTSLACLKIGGAHEACVAACPAAAYAESLTAARARLDQFALIGGTAWAFSDPALRGTLDYLFVDEAGQVSVANLIGMAPAAHNLVLIGDQMQLGQPLQGSHPGESGLSCLDYLLQGCATIAEDKGIFLGRTWRLHPRVCQFISGAVYEGRLQPAPHTGNRIIRVPPTARQVTREAGLLFVPVSHAGNTQGSDEEVAVIRLLVEELVGREVTDEQGHVKGRLQLEDILFVAPYNMQVRKLSRVLGPSARVGSVDKFQGQEAPVVILSMCASQGEGSPRGLEFLLHKQRLNVALSRAQSLAIVVANPALAQTRCQSLSQMTLLNLFCRVMLEGGEDGESVSVGRASTVCR